MQGERTHASKLVTPKHKGHGFPCPGNRNLVTGYCESAAPPGLVALSTPSSCGLGIFAVSGFNRPLWSGPRPNLIRARESGVILVCQPLSAWNLTMASLDDWSQTPVGSPFR